MIIKTVQQQHRRINGNEEIVISLKLRADGRNLTAMKQIYINVHTQKRETYSRLKRLKLFALALKSNYHD